MDGGSTPLRVRPSAAPEFTDEDGAPPNTRPRRAGRGLPSARDWWRRTEVATAPGASRSARAPGSPSRSPWPRAGTPARRHGRLRSARPARRPRSRASSSWTTTRTRFASCTTRSPRRAAPTRVTAEPGEAAGLIRTERPQLALLDLVLPGTGGIEPMAEVPELSDLPVVFISDYGRDETIARAFASRPAPSTASSSPSRRPSSPRGSGRRFAPARARRRSCSARSLAIDYERRRVTVDGRAVALTATEYEILCILPVDAGRVVMSESLLRPAWDAGEPTDTERVRTFVKQLRAKLGDDATRPADIFNERAVGYRMATLDEE